MTRLAFFSPVPPAPTGIADYAAEVLALLAPRYDLEVFHDQQAADQLPCPAHRVAAFAARHASQPFDLTVYQIGNAPVHAFAYEPMLRAPGLLVLHDLVLHHARARSFLDTPAGRAYAADPSNAALREAALREIEPYRQELARSYPRQAERLVQAQLATVGDLLPYAYPLFRMPVEASRLVAVHNGYMADAIRAEVPGTEVVRIPMTAAQSPVASDAVAALRGRYGVGVDDFVVASFGLMTREKQIGMLARAVARAAEAISRLRLMLVGPVPDSESLAQSLAATGVQHRTIVTGRVPLAELPAYMELADVVVHLRYPTARETSAALLRVLAQGRPAIVSDLEQLADVPDNAVVRADLSDEEGDVTRALLQLNARPELRARLGANAAAFVRREHSGAACLAGYQQAIERALRLPDPPRA